MEDAAKIYESLFPHTSFADWFYALLGLVIHALLKLKTVPLKHFKWRIFLDDFISVWAMSIISIVVCLGTLPQVLDSYSLFDSAMIGYASSSIFKTLTKTRLSKLGE
jgi:hypothetical protein